MSGRRAKALRRVVYGSELSPRERDLGWRGQPGRVLRFKDSAVRIVTGGAVANAPASRRAQYQTLKRAHRRWRTTGGREVLA